MSEISVISEIKKALVATGPATCSQIAQAINAAPQDIIPVLRDAIDRGTLAEKNGFYDICRKASESCRSSYAWVEGNAIPAWVMRLACGPKTCESVDIVAEVDRAKRAQGWPPFILASIDVRLSHFQYVSTGEIISHHVLRYMPLDTRTVRTL